MKQETPTQFFFNLVKPYRYIAFLIILLSLLGSVFDGMSIGILVPLLSNLQKIEGAQNLPKVFQWLVALLRPYSAERQIFVAIGFVILAVSLKNLFIALSIRLGHWLGARLLADLRLRAMKLLLRVSLEFHHQSKASDLIEKAINSTGQVGNLAKMFVEFVADVLTFVMLCAMLFILSWQLTLLTFVLGAIFMLFLSFHIKGLRRTGKSEMDAGKDMMGLVHESLGGIHLLKTYSKERRQISELQEALEAYRRIEYRRSFKTFAVHPLTDVLGTLAISTLFVIAMLVYRMDTQLMLTQLLPFIYILLRLVPLLKILNGKTAEIASRRHHVNIVHELLCEADKPFIPNGEKIFSGVKQEIEFRAVTFVYGGHNKHVLRDVSFSIPAGKTTALVGESGAGKSTIANLLLRFYDPQQGKILFDGEPLPNFRLESYHRKIGVVSQDTFLFNNTVKFNIAFSLDETPSDEQIIAAAKKAGAHEFIMDLPNGYDTIIGDRGVKLSGGQRQRISIARAILRDPEILILDEATSALDAKTERRIHEAIRELSQGRTVIIIAHRLSTIKNADQIVVLRNGQVIEMGSPEGLLNQKSEYYRLTSI